MTVVTIFYIILLLSASVLCIALVIYLNKITKSIKEIENDIKDLSSQAKPFIQTATLLSDELNDISGSVKGQLETTKKIVSKVDERVDDILGFEEKLREGLEEPAFRLIKTLSAVANGVNVFWNTFTKK